MKNATWIVVALCGLSVACAHGTGDLAHDTYPEAQAEVRQRLDDIWAAAAAKDVARLESYHLYGPKFTAFKDGAPRGDAEANRAGEHMGGKPIGVNLESTMIFAKAGGEWKLVHEHFSPLGAPPGA